MEDLFKKFIYAGVGFVSRTNDRVQDTINQLVTENKLSQKEGEKIMQALQKNTDTKRKEFETQINSIAKRVMKGMGVASNEDVEDLKRAVKGTGSKAAATKSGTATASSTNGTKKASGSTSTASKAKTAATGTAKAAGAASTSAKKSAAGSKGGGAAKKSATTTPAGGQGSTGSSNA